MPGAATERTAGPGAAVITVLQIASVVGLTAIGSAVILWAVLFRDAP